MQQVQQMFLLHHSSAVYRNFLQLGGLLISHLTGRIKEQDGLVIVPVKIRFDQFAAGTAKVSVTRFAERSKNSEGRLTSDIDR